MADTPERKLAVLLHADVVGSTALVQLNETLAHERIQDAFRRFSETITSHGGVAHEIRGDALVAEFSKASDAVAAAVDFQAANTDHNEKLPDEFGPVVRVGIAMGEVVVADNTVTGEGIVLAQRLEQLAEPGGVCIQDAAYQTVPKRLPFNYTNLGDRELKGFDEPVRAYTVRRHGEEPITAPEETSPIVSTGLELPEKPSIAVLPFTNMSGDPEQEYFSDGITEDIITELSRFSMVSVIARQSSFALKGEKVGIKEVAEKLGVQYVVEGSVRRAGNRVRITAQLIEAETGNHIWAERYDRELEDIFAVQDEVTRSVVAVLPGRVEEHVAHRASRRPTDNINAYELMLQGKSYRDRLNPQDTATARQFYEKAIVLDPRYARAHAYLSDTYFMDILLGLATEDASRLSFELARTAAILDSNDILCKDQLGFAYMTEGRWEDAESQFEKTLSQVTNEADSTAWIGLAFMLLGYNKKARDIVLEAKRLDPLHPHGYDWILGQANYMLGNYGEVVRILTGEALLNSLAHALVVGAYAHLGRTSDCHTALASFVSERHEEFRSRNIQVKDDTIDSLAGGYRKLWRREEDWNNIVDGLRKAGLPD